MREKLSIVVDYESITQVTKLEERGREGGGKRERERERERGREREGEREREKREKGGRERGKLEANVSVMRSKIIIITLSV